MTTKKSTQIRKRVVKVTVKRHERNKGDGLIQEGHERAYKYGKYYYTQNGQYAIKVHGKIYLFHSPKTRAKQTAEEVYKGIVYGHKEVKDSVASPLEEKLLDTQNFPDKYRDKIKNFTTRAAWAKKGLVYILEHDPGYDGGESNKHAASRIARYILYMRRYIEDTLEGSETQVIAVTHGPMPEHFLTYAYLDGYNPKEAEKAIREIGGAFDNGDTFQVTITKDEKGTNYEISREGIKPRIISHERLEGLAKNYKGMFGPGNVPSLGSIK